MLQCCRSMETLCREGMSLLGLYNGDDWKDAIFWQQPVRYNTDSYYQGRAFLCGANTGSFILIQKVHLKLSLFHQKCCSVIY